MKNLKFKCVINHNIKNTTIDELLGLLAYLGRISEILIVHPNAPYSDKGGRGWGHGPINAQNTIIKIINSEFEKQEFEKVKNILKDKLDYTTDDIEKDLISHGEVVLSLDSNEIPLVQFFEHMHEYLEIGDCVGVPLIHMRYKDEFILLKDIHNESSRKVKFKNFLNQPNIFHEIEDTIDIRLRDSYNGAVPNIPLSSKWIGWPASKTILKRENQQTAFQQTALVTNMHVAVYKFERVVGE